MKDVIRKEAFFNHPISEVWKAISDGAEISEWFISADFKAQKDYEYTFTHEKTTITGKVLIVNPVYDLSYTWIVKGASAETTVKWHLEEKDGGTQLTLEHSGISNYPGEEVATKMFSSFDAGWDSCIQNLNGYLTKTTYASQ